MKHVIVGTAGHIDHGKTALVKALTGIDTDRLEEEKRRGISIELGFAHLELGPDLRLGFVDVPGHERFVKNMLAGAWGIDLVLLVVAADESIKPQTREHFEICRLLGIRRGLVALTKADLVEPDLLELVRLEIEEFLAGSFLEGAPILAVSSLTGEGLAELRQALAEMAARTPEKDATRHFRLPVDRSFSMRGFGTVVTGTLMSGSVTREQELEAHPGGRRLRVRGIQVHGQPVERALAGQRTALNLAGAEPAELPRGTVLTAPGLFRPVKQLDCRLELLASARPLKHRAPVHFHAGTAEVQAEVRLLEGQTLAPGAQAWARLVLREPVLVLPGDRFIIRMFSPVVTIGGGLIVDIGGRRYRSGEPAGERLSTLAWGEPAQRIALLVREAPYGMSPSALIARTGWMPAEIEEAARRAGLFVLRKPELWLADRAWLERAIAALREALETFHRRNPLQPGMPKQELRARLLPRAPAFLLDALIEQSGGALVAEGEAVRLAGHRVRLAEQEEQALAAIEQAFQSAGLAVPATSEALAKSGLPPARARELLQILIRRGKLLRLGDELVFHADALEGLRALLARHRGERFSVARFKDLTGISRKYAIPLLEYLDRERVTRREGDERIVL